MSRIKILPEILSNKIAAGEVVERPASVVKELVENALDAGAGRIVVEVEKGGRSLIRVADNGTGMGRDDALLALERYATSKIRTDKDLFAIQTLGFRGEALPSIASVSRFSLVSREAGADNGVEIRVEGGKIRDVSEVGAPTGTMITVRQLFYNTPARRKFLKTVATEMGHITDVVASRALSHPEVYFKLLHNGRTVKSWPAAAAAEERVADVLGRDARRHLLPVDFESDGVCVSGWVAAPPFVRATGQAISVFVNRRPVRSRVVLHGLMQGYRGRLMKGQFPVAVLFVKVPCDQVDVNVHPTKHEVRFYRQKPVHDGIRRAVAAALSRSGGSAGDHWTPPRREPDIRESTPGFHSRPADTRQPGQNALHPLPDNAAASRGRLPGPPQSPAGPEGTQPDLPPETPQSGRPRQGGLWPGGLFGDLTVIGQAHNTYILCQSSEGLVLVDQHAAHERILYEQLSRRAAERLPAVQTLLIPEPIEMGHRHLAVLESLASEFSALGLEIEPFGPNAFAVTAVPALLADRPAAPLVVEIVEKTAEIGVSAGMERILDQALKLMACHAAIRAHQALTDTQMQALLSQLDLCDNPFHCPHGRPTWIRWSKRELEKMFGRVV